MVDYLDGTVDEVKESIRNASDVDYEELLKEEEEGKDRKTVKEFLEKKIGEEVDEHLDEVEETEEEVEDELVEEIEEETREGLLGSFNRTQLVSGGALFGIIAGLLLAAVLSSTGAIQMDGTDQVSQTQATDTVEELLTASGQYSADQVSVAAQMQNNMYYMNVSVSQMVNGTERTQSQTYFMTTDGALLFPEVIQSPFGAQNVAIDVDQAIQRAQQQPEEPAGNETDQQANTTQ